MVALKQFRCQLWLPAPLEKVWDFHKDPQNLVKISPDFLRMHLEGVPEVMGKGSSFQIQTHHKFLSPFLKWTAEYLEWNEEADHKSFVDTQREGPFHVWKHKHEFNRGLTQLEVDGKSFRPKEAGTWILDHLEYSLKPQLRAFEWIAERMIAQLFVFRKRRLEKLFTA